MRICSNLYAAAAGSGENVTACFIGPGMVPHCHASPSAHANSRRRPFVNTCYRLTPAVPASTSRIPAPFTKPVVTNTSRGQPRSPSQQGPPLSEYKSRLLFTKPAGTIINRKPASFTKPTGTNITGIYRRSPSLKDHH